MDYALLRSLRALGPGLILLAYFDLYLVLSLGWCAIFWPLDTSKILIVGYVVGGIYGSIASSLGRDKYAFDDVQESLKEALSSVDPIVDALTWRDVSPCFYHLVDSDNSLGQKSKGIYFNGFIVTTSFDAIWISLIAAVVGGFGIAFLGFDWSFLLLSIFVLAVAFLVWRLSIERHKRLGREQVHVIKKRFSRQFADCLKGMVASSGATS